MTSLITISESAWSSKFSKAIVFVALSIPFYCLLITDQVNEPLRVILAFFFVIVLPGYLFWNALHRNSNRIESIAAGSVTAISALALGSLFTSKLEIEIISYVPWLTMFAFGILKSDFKAGRKVNDWGIGAAVGACVASIVTVKTLRAVLNTQPTTWPISWEFYNDLPFHVSLVASARTHADGAYLFLPSLDITYTWMLHAFLGAFGKFSGSTALELMMQVWPVINASLTWLLIAALALRVTKSNLAAFLAPIFHSIFVGPIVLSETFLRYSWSFSVSPTFEFGLLLTMTILLHLSRSFSDDNANSLARNANVIVLFVLVFIGTAGKGSGWLIYGFGFTASLLGVWRKSGEFKKLLALTSIAFSAVIVAIFGVVRTKQSLSISPLTTLQGYSINPALDVLLGSLFVLIPMIASHQILIKKPCQSRLEVNFMAGSVLGGTLGILVFDHFGKSQLYFYFAIVPFLCVMVACALAKISSHYGYFTLILAGLAVVLFSKYSTSQQNQNQATVIFMTISLATFVFLTAAMIRMLKEIAKGREFTKAKLASYQIVLVVFVFVFFAQPFGKSTPTYSGETPVTNPYALSKERFDALNFIKSSSGVDDVVLSNNHCMAGDVGTDTCYDRQFYASAITERKIFYETAAYTFQISGPEELERLRLTEELYKSSTSNVASQLYKNGVRYIYVDKAKPHDGDLSRVAKIVFTNSEAEVWKLNAFS